MFAGYWNRPDATVEATRNLWFHTGDLGRIDEDGYIYFVDRKKDALRRRGENISSFEMEKMLFGHAGDHGRRRARGAERARRGRREGHRRAAGRRASSPRRSCAAGWPSACRTSRSRATSSSATTCPATRSAGCSSTSSATRASPRATWDREAAGVDVRAPVAAGPIARLRAHVGPGLESLRCRPIAGDAQMPVVRLPAARRRRAVPARCSRSSWRDRDAADAPRRSRPPRSRAAPAGGRDSPRRSPAPVGPPGRRRRPVAGARPPLADARIAGSRRRRGPRRAPRRARRDP